MNKTPRKTILKKRSIAEDRPCPVKKALIVSNSLTRATVCPVPGHPCLSDVDPAAVVAAVDLLCSEMAVA